MRVARGFILVGFVFFSGSPVVAHEVRPGYLEIVEKSDGVFDILWKVPARRGRRLSLKPTFPSGTKVIVPVTTHSLVDSFADRWTVRIVGDLAGSTLGISGLSGTRTDVLVRVQFLDGREIVPRLTPDHATSEVDEAADLLGVAVTYVVLGVEHILIGIDHLLFVLALMILIEGHRRLIGAITAFTIAHSITLGIASLGFVHFPQKPVEAVIALSIVFLAVEISRNPDQQPSITKRRPWIAAFAFGLLHGFGFAGALSEVGLPGHAIPIALLCFNVGVELGQLIFIAVAMVCLGIVVRLAPKFWQGLARVPIYGIGVVSMFWLIERVAGFV